MRDKDSEERIKQLEAELAEAEAEIVNLCTARSQYVQGGAPFGWKLVPLEPTPEMMREGADFLPVTPGGATNKCAGSVYTAMLDAAPSISKDSQ
jgi:hypothetical protein